MQNAWRLRRMSICASVKIVGDARMLDHDALWRSGRARGVDDVGGVVRVEASGGAVAGCRAIAGQSASSRTTLRAGAPASAGQPVEQRLLRHQHRRAGVRQHERQPLRRVVRVERQIGAAGLEDAEQPDHHLGRALDAQPDHDLGPDAEAAQMMRQPVGVRVERARSSARGPRTPPRPRPACAPPAPQTAPAASRRRDRDCAGVVPAPQDGVRAPPASRIVEAARSRDPASATAASSSRIRRRPSASIARRDRTGRWRIPARPSIPAGAPSGAALLDQLTDRSNFALAVATGSGRAASPGSSSAHRPRRSANASITWNSGCRDSDRAGLSTSTSRSNGRSWWP